MAKSQMDQLTDDAINKKGILAKLYFDMHSERAEELQPIMTDLVNERLLKAPGVLYCYGGIEEPLQGKDGQYSTSAEITVLFNDIGALINIVFNFAPVGVEILKPTGEYRIATSDLQSVLLSLADISVSYSDYILSRVLTPEARERVKHDMENRKLVGDRLIERKKTVNEGA
jgi:hypothetical protein